MKIKTLLSTLLIVSSTVFGQNLENAIKNTDNELFTKSEEEIKALIAKEPTKGINYYYLGENFYQRKETDSALVYWAKAFEKDPTSPISFVSNGKALLVKGDLTGANEQFNKALTTTKRKNAEIIRNIANAYIVTGGKNYDEIISLLQRAIEIDGKNENNFILMGDVLLAKSPDNVNEAIKNYNLVLDINPKSARGIVRKGKIYQRLNTNSTDSLANEFFKEAQRLDPNYAPAYRENAELFLNSNKPKKAIENWKIYLELNNSLEARYRYATALYSGKQYCDAVTELNNLKQAGFSNIYTLRILTYSLAECTSDKENAQRGLQSSEEYFKIAPKEKIIYLDYKYKGQLLANAGKDSLAIAEYEKVASMDEKAKKEVCGLIAKSYMKAKNYAKAIENYEYKAQNSTLTATELFELGRAYYVGPKNYQLADTTFAKLTTLSPSFVSGHFWRGRASYQLDPKNEKWLAKPYYEKAFDLIKVEDRLTGNNKSVTLESAKYLGNYYYSSITKDIEKAKNYWKVVQEMDANDPEAKAFFAKVK